MPQHHARTSVVRLFSQVSLTLCVAFVLGSLFAPIYTPYLHRWALVPPTPAALAPAPLPEAPAPAPAQPPAPASIVLDADILKTPALDPIHDDPIPEHPARPCYVPSSLLRQHGIHGDVELACTLIRHVALPDIQGQPLPEVAQIDAAHGYLWNKSVSASTASGRGVAVDGAEVHHLTLRTRTLLEPVDDAPRYLFGVATDASRLISSIVHLRRYLSHSRARLVVHLPPSDAPRVDELRSHLAAQSISADVVVSSTDDFLQRYADLVPLLDEKRQGEQWCILIDDDTVFLSIAHLDLLASRYDATRPWYIGGITEDWRQIIGVKLIAFGGAGVVLSAPLVDAMAERYQDVCSRFEGPGDSRVAQCVYATTLTKLTIEPSLRQGDLLGDVRGLMESGRWTTSLHHWKSWFHVDVVALQEVGDVCSAGCVLQRFVFGGAERAGAGESGGRGRGQVVLTNGYDIVEYAEGVEVEAKRMQRTWNVEPGSDFQHSLAPLRDPLVEGSERWTWSLIDARRIDVLDADRRAPPTTAGGNNKTVPGVRQTYHLAAASTREEKDRIVMLVWI
ncbi:hypothetical protein ACQY0O_008441 [Thecaphora frezii]